jgi:hypothetical protein
MIRISFLYWELFSGAPASAIPLLYKGSHTPRSFDSKPSRHFKADHTGS